VCALQVLVAACCKVFISGFTCRFNSSFLSIILLFLTLNSPPLTGEFTLFFVFVLVIFLLKCVCVCVWVCVCVCVFSLSIASPCRFLLSVYRLPGLEFIVMRVQVKLWSYWTKSSIQCAFFRVVSLCLTRSVLTGTP